MPTVTVRTYRPGGIGDCFLLSFQDEGAAHVLIDFGVLLATRDKPSRLRAIADDIHRVTDGRLDVVVATHEHYDHLSGFEFAHAAFEGFEVGEVWVAWTEDPSDELANSLRQGRDQAFAALTAARTALGPRSLSLGAVLDFFGAVAVGAPRGTTAQLEFVQKLTAQPRFLSPGQVRLVPKTRTKAFVLGPPRDRALLTRSNPSTVDSEVYGAAFALERAFYAGAGLTGDPVANYPFSATHGVPLEEASALPEFQSYFETRHRWRSIGDDWLRAAEMLALKLDEDTNNTSLVLAFELSDGRVLLFPADAQVGNWLSWQTVSFDDGPSSEDLLARTVLYKVGHHGSHNATLRDGGLEAMTNRDLVALLPVDEEQAATQGRHGWRMPFGPLYTRLQEKTRHRIIRSDLGVASARPRGVEARTWQDFTARVTERDLSVDYEVG
jgi:hypothetical protein